MLFNTYGFIFGFLPAAVFLFHLFGKRSRTLAALWLLLASLLFYGMDHARFLPVLVDSFFFNFLVGLGLIKWRGKPRWSRMLLAAGIAANLLVLGYFKYSRFFAETIHPEWVHQWSLSAVVLPLGISFFTFTQIAFLVDAYRGEVQDTNPLHYALFVTYFPHLIAGPIFHHEEMIAQFKNPECYRLRAENVASGLALFAVGLFKKTVLADPLSSTVGQVFGPGVLPGFFEAWGGALSYTLQIYFDFSGYMDMAVGMSLFFGFKLPANFNSPYRAVNIIDFWRRWHMTLSRFLRDYLYIPLGGGRRGVPRTFANIGITMLLGGLWHGANWTFVAWGALHALYMMINRLWIGWKASRGWEGRGESGWARASAIGLTFTAVTVGWVLFRADSLGGAWTVLQGMAGFRGLSSGQISDGLGFAGWLRILLSLGVVWFLPNSRQWMRDFQCCLGETPPPETGTVPIVWKPSWKWLFATVLLFYTAMVFAAKDVQSFLYYQF